MAALRPFNSRTDLFEKANSAWFSCKKKDWLEAFTHHPRIGDVTSLKEKFASTATWASGEQGRAQEASDKTLEELKIKLNLLKYKSLYIFNSSNVLSFLQPVNQLKKCCLL